MVILFQWGFFLSTFWWFFFLLFSINFTCFQCFDVCIYFFVRSSFPNRLFPHIRFSIILFDAGFAQLLSHHVYEHIFYHSFRPADCFSPFLFTFLSVSSSICVCLFFLAIFSFYPATCQSLTFFFVRCLFNRSISLQHSVQFPRAHFAQSHFFLLSGQMQ